MNVLDGADTTSLNEMAWILIKLVGLYFFVPALFIALILKYVFKLRGAAFKYIMVFAELVIFYYVFKHFDGISNSLK